MSAKQKTLFQTWKDESQKAPIIPYITGDNHSSKINGHLKSTRKNHEANLRNGRNTLSNLRQANIPLGNVENAEEFSDFDMVAGKTWIYPTNYPIRDYQFSIVKQALFKNTMVVLPTGLGKTFIAAVIMYNLYRWYPHGKVVFMAPTRPLVVQQVDSCFKVTGICQEDTAQMTGTNPSQERKKIWQSKRVFFLTPHTLANDLACNICPAASIKCLVIDEAHKALGNYAYCEVVKQLLTYTTKFRVLALTATPGSDVKAVKQVLANLLISHVELRTEESLDIRPYTHDRNIEKIVVPLGDELHSFKMTFLDIINLYLKRLNQKKAVTTRNPTTLSKFQVLKLREYFSKHTHEGTDRCTYNLIMADFSLCISLYHAYELLLLHGIKPFYQFLTGIMNGAKSIPYARTELQKNGNFGEMMEKIRKKYISDKPATTLNVAPGCSNSKNTSHEFKRFVPGHPKLVELEEVVLTHFRNFVADGTTGTRVMIFSEYRDSVDEIEEMLGRHKPLVRVMSFIGQSSKAGNKAGYSQKHQLEVMQQFRNGGYNTLVSTCVGEEGLDIGEVDLIICYDCPKSPIRLVQRMGRTGRFRQGKIVVLVTEGKEDQAYNKSMSQKSNIFQAITEGSLFSQLYRNSPRMVPQSLKPDCVKMVMKIEPKTIFSKKVLKIDKKETAELNDEELLYFEKHFKFPKSNIPLLQTSDFVSLRSPDKQVNKEHADEMQGLISDIEKPRLSVNSWMPWQNMAQKTYMVSHSTKTHILIDTLQVIDFPQSNLKFSYPCTSSPPINPITRKNKIKVSRKISKETSLKRGLNHVMEQEQKKISFKKISVNSKDSIKTSHLQIDNTKNQTEHQNSSTIHLFPMIELDQPANSVFNLPSVQSPKDQSNAPTIVLDCETSHVEDTENNFLIKTPPLICDMSWIDNEDLSTIDINNIISTNSNISLILLEIKEKVMSDIMCEKFIKPTEPLKDYMFDNGLKSKLNRKKKILKPINQSKKIPVKTINQSKEIPVKTKNQAQEIPLKTNYEANQKSIDLVNFKRGSKIVSECPAKEQSSCNISRSNRQWNCEEIAKENINFNPDASFQNLVSEVTQGITSDENRQNFENISFSIAAFDLNFDRESPPVFTISTDQNVINDNTEIKNYCDTKKLKPVSESIKPIQSENSTSSLRRLTTKEKSSSEIKKSFSVSSKDDSVHFKAPHKTSQVKCNTNFQPPKIIESTELTMPTEKSNASNISLHKAQLHKNNSNVNIVTEQKHLATVNTDRTLNRTAIKNCTHKGNSSALSKVRSPTNCDSAPGAQNMKDNSQENFIDRLFIGGNITQSRMKLNRCSKSVAGKVENTSHNFIEKLSRSTNASEIPIEPSCAVPLNVKAVLFENRPEYVFGQETAFRKPCDILECSGEHVTAMPLMKTNMHNSGSCNTLDATKAVHRIQPTVAESVLEEHIGQKSTIKVNCSPFTKFKVPSCSSSLSIIAKKHEAKEFKSTLESKFCDHDKSMQSTQLSLTQLASFIDYSTFTQEDDDLPSEDTQTQNNETCDSLPQPPEPYPDCDSDEEICPTPPKPSVIKATSFSYKNSQFSQSSVENRNFSQATINERVDWPENDSESLLTNDTLKNFSPFHTFSKDNFQTKLVSNGIIPLHTQRNNSVNVCIQQEKTEPLRCEEPLVLEPVSEEMLQFDITFDFPSTQKEVRDVPSDPESCSLLNEEFNSSVPLKNSCSQNEIKSLPGKAQSTTLVNDKSNSLLSVYSRDKDANSECTKIENKVKHCTQKEEKRKNVPYIFKSSKVSDFDDDDFILPKRPKIKNSSTSSSGNNRRSSSKKENFEFEVKQYVIEEAEVSICNAASEDESEHSDFDQFESSFIDDNSHTLELTDQRGLYLRSIKNCVGLPQKYKLQFDSSVDDNVCSQPVEDVSPDYMLDSFCVKNDEFIYVNSSDDNVLEIKSKKTKKVKHKGKRKRIIVHDSSSEEVSPLKRYKPASLEIKPVNVTSSDSSSSPEVLYHRSNTGDTWKKPNLVKPQSPAGSVCLTSATEKQTDLDSDFSTSNSITKQNRPSLVSRKNEDELRHANFHQIDKSPVVPSVPCANPKEQILSIDHSVNISNSIPKKANQLGVENCCEQLLNSTSKISFDIAWSNDFQPSGNLTDKSQTTSNALVASFSKYSHRTEKTPCQSAPTPLTILVNSRELAGGKPVINALRNTFKTEPCVMHLTAADYIVSNRVAVDRIQDTELSSFQTSTKILEKVRTMRDLYEKGCVIIEKDNRKPTFSFNKDQIRHLEFATSVLQHTSLKVLYSTSPEDTSRILFELANGEKKRGMHITVPVSLQNKRLQLFEFYASLPNVSPICALNFMYNFPVINDFVKSSAEDLQKAGFLSSKRSHHIHWYLNTCFKV